MINWIDFNPTHQNDRFSSSGSCESISPYSFLIWQERDIYESYIVDERQSHTMNGTEFLLQIGEHQTPDQAKSHCLKMAELQEVIRNNALDGVWLGV